MYTLTCQINNFTRLRYFNTLWNKIGIIISTPFTFILRSMDKTVGDILNTNIIIIKSIAWYTADTFSSRTGQLAKIRKLSTSWSEVDIPISTPFTFILRSIDKAINYIFETRTILLKVIALITSTTYLWVVLL